MVRFLRALSSTEAAAAILRAGKDRVVDGGLHLPSGGSGGRLKERTPPSIKAWKRLIIVSAEQPSADGFERQCRRAAVRASILAE